jgi:PTH1 family peptidyl-tRNA hydrolase
MIRMVVGLGNPGKSYQGTRHNVGQRVVESAEKNNLIPRQVLVFRRQSPFYRNEYMNELGLPISRVMQYHKLKPSELLVVCDDFSIPLGALRIRPAGSSGGHNGLQSILDTLETQQIPRLRVGIGPVSADEDPVDFVLKRFAKNETATVEEVTARAAEAIRTILLEGIETAMNRYNQKGAA